MKQVNLTLMSVDKNSWINTIKTVREVGTIPGLPTGFGLKEAKEFVDAVRDGCPQTLYRNIPESQARKVKRMFQKVNAIVKLGKFDSEVSV